MPKRREESGIINKCSIKTEKAEDEEKRNKD